MVLNIVLNICGLLTLLNVGSSGTGCLRVFGAYKSNPLKTSGSRELS